MTELKHRSLRAALNAAAADMVGLVDKSGHHTEHNYAYVGHEHVLDHTRGMLLKHGVCIAPVELRFLCALEARKGSALYLWEQVAEVTHVNSGEQLVTRVQVTTLPSEQSASKASTGADRMLLMRLCRLGGAGLEHDRETGEMRRRAEQREQRPQHRESVGAEALAGRLLEDLGKLPTNRADFERFFSRARSELHRMNASDQQRTRVRTAFDARCKAIGLDPASFDKPREDRR